MQSREFRNNSDYRIEQGPVKKAGKASNALDDYRGSGSASDPLALKPRKKGLFDRAKGAVKDVGESAFDLGKDVVSETLETLDVPAQYTLRPAIGAALGLGANVETDPATGKKFIGKTSWGERAAGLKELVTQNPIDSYREGKTAFEQRLNDPKNSAGERMLLAGASDPLNFIGPGLVGKALRVAPAAIRSTRAARAAATAAGTAPELRGSLKAAATILEAPRAAAVGGVAGSALAAEGAERAGLGPTGQTVAALAGGLTGGVALSLGSRIRPPSGADFEAPSPKSLGKTATVKGRQEYKFRYRLVDLDDLTASHDEWNFTENQSYAQAIQPRSRDGVAERSQVEAMALEMDVDRMLADTADLQNGVPIVGPDGLVESGNGRTMAMRRVAKDNPEKYAEYVRALQAKLGSYGIDEAEITSTTKPYLVRERVTQLDEAGRIAFADEANGASTLRMGTVQTAKGDARRIPDAMLHAMEVPDTATLDQVFNSPKSAGFIRSFMEALPPNERAALMDGRGMLNDAGLQRLKAAFFAKTYAGTAGERLLADFFESANPEVRNIRNGMESSLPAVARIEAGIRAGTVAPELSLAEDVAMAADAISKLKSGTLKFKSIEDYLAQQSMFGDEIELSPQAREILRFMGENAKSGKQIREALRNYANDALDLPPPNQSDMFGGVGPGQGFAEVWKRATGRVMPEAEVAQGGLDMGSGRVDVAAAPQADIPTKLPGEPTPAPEVEVPPIPDRGSAPKIDARKFRTVEGKPPTWYAVDDDGTVWMYNREAKSWKEGQRGNPNAIDAFINDPRFVAVKPPTPQIGPGWVDGRQVPRQPAPEAPAPEAPAKIRVYHGNAGPIEGGKLRPDAFVTTDRKAAQTFADAEARLNGGEAKVWEFDADPSALKDADGDFAATYGGAKLVGDPDGLTAVETSSAAPAARSPRGSSNSGSSKPSKVTSEPEPSASPSETSAPQTAPGASSEPAASNALIKSANEESPNASSERPTDSEAARDASSGIDDTVPPRGNPPPLGKVNDHDALKLDPNKGPYSDADLKAAYRAQSRRYHPDVNDSPTALEDMKRINNAYDRLRARETAGPRWNQPGARYRDERTWQRAWEEARSQARKERNEFEEELKRYAKAREGNVGDGFPGGRPTGAPGGGVGEPPLMPPDPPREPPMGAGKGGTQAFGGKPDEDLFKTLTRRENINRAKAAQNTTSTKAWNTLKAQFGRLSSEKERTRVDPFLDDKQRIDSQIGHIAEWFVTSERMILKASGLEARNVDGTFHLFANDQDVGIFDDVIEGTSDAGKAARSELTDMQNDAIGIIQEHNDALNGNIRFHGGQPQIDPDIDGDYFGRRVLAREYDTANGKKRVEKAEGLNSSSRVGSNRMKSRTVENVEQLREMGFELDDPWTARLAITRGKLMTAEDSYLGKSLKPLRVRRPGSTFGLATVADHPAFNGSWFEPEIAARIQKGLAAPERGTPERLIRAINGTLTPLRASFDLSASLQQGLRLWLTDPKAAGEFQWGVMRSLKDDSVYDGMLLKLNSEGPGIEYLTSVGVRFTGEAAREEFALPALFENKLAGAKGPVGLVARPLGKGFELSNKHFSRTLNAYRIHMANSSYKRFVDAGLEGADLDEAMKSAANGVNRSFGWTYGKPTTIEEAVLFAPKYFRASIETVLKIGERGIEGDMARKHMGLLLAEGAAVVFMANAARGKETEWKDPTDPNWLRIRDVGGIDVSPFGTYNTLFQAIAGTVLGKENESAVGGRVEKLWRLAEGKMSPGMKLVYEPFVKRETYLGEPLDPLGSLKGFEETMLEQAKSTVPFGVQNLIEEGPLAAGIGSLGVSGTPMTPAEKRDNARAAGAKKLFGRDYESLSGAQKAEVNGLEDVDKHQDEVDERSQKSSGDAGRATEIRVRSESELKAAAEDLARGTDESGNQFTGEDFRRSYNDTMLRAAGARDLLEFKGGDKNVGGWFELYDQATMANGQVDYDKLERLQGVYRASHPGIDDEVDKAVGVRDNPAVRELRLARKEASAYYELPAYRGMSVEDSERAGAIITMANDLVSFGQARNRAAALRMLAARDAEGVRLARRASNAGPNPAREQYRKSHDLFARFYSSVSPMLAA